MTKAPKKGAPKKEGTRPIRMKVSGNVYAYLSLLKRVTMLGKSENDVAERLLTDRLLEMLADKYHEKGTLPDAAKPAEPDKSFP
jgi:hypothetical protein